MSRKTVTKEICLAARRCGLSLEQVTEVTESDGRRPFRRYQSQKRQAQARGIEFRLTFWEWWSLWRDSGRYHQMGCRRGEYVMARIWDAGPYAVGNVEIQTNAENTLTRLLRKRFKRVGVKPSRLIEREDFVEGLDQG